MLLLVAKVSVCILAFSYSKVNSTVVVFTKNQLRIAKKLKIKGDFKQIQLLPSTLSYCKVVLFLLADHYLLSHLLFGLRTSVVRVSWLRFLKVIGYCNYLELIIAKTEKKYVQFNDHSPQNFYAVELCERQGVESIYIQHAPVSDKFPALYHDVNILFSEDSLHKYKVLPSKEVKVWKDLRFECLLLNKASIEPKIKNILLCPNLMDDRNAVYSTYNFFKENEFEVKIRRHPADLLGWKKEYMYSTESLIWDDLEWSDIVITNESAVPLEAVFYNKTVFKLTSWSPSLDNYGFLEKGFLLKEFDSNEEILLSLKGKTKVVDKSKLNYFLGNLENDYTLNLC